MMVGLSQLGSWEDRRVVQPRRVRVLSIEELEQLSMARLLAYRKKLLMLEDSPVLGDWGEAQLDHLEPGYVYFKDSPAWAETAAAAKALLDLRPHSEG